MKIYKKSIAIEDKHIFLHEYISIALIMICIKINENTMLFNI